MGVSLGSPFLRFQALQGNKPSAETSAGQDEQAADAALQRLKSERYAHIMAHEQAHQSAAGAFGGGIVINYDGNGVACSGHVPISIPALDPQNPEASMKAYNTIKNAALAPGDPSGQDMAVAAMAQARIGQAQVLMQQKQRTKTQKP